MVALGKEGGLVGFKYQGGNKTVVPLHTSAMMMGLSQPY